MSSPLHIFDIHSLTTGIDSYHNSQVSEVNDHVIRLSVMTAPFYWHYHPNSDESFLVMEGILCVDLEDHTVELAPGQLFTVPTGTRHRTRPKGERSVNLTFERKDMETVRFPRPH